MLKLPLDVKLRMLEKSGIMFGREWLERQVRKEDFDGRWLIGGGKSLMHSTMRAFKAVTSGDTFHLNGLPSLSEVYRQAETGTYFFSNKKEATAIAVRALNDFSEQSKFLNETYLKATESGILIQEPATLFAVHHLANEVPCINYLGEIDTTLDKHMAEAQIESGPLSIITLPDGKVLSFKANVLAYTINGDARAGMLDIHGPDGLAHLDRLDETLITLNWANGMPVYLGEIGDKSLVKELQDYIQESILSYVDKHFPDSSNMIREAWKDKGEEFFLRDEQITRRAPVFEYHHDTLVDTQSHAADLVDRLLDGNLNGQVFFGDISSLKEINIDDWIDDLPDSFETRTHVRGQVMKFLAEKLIESQKNSHSYDDEDILSHVASMAAAIIFHDEQIYEEDTVCGNTSIPTRRASDAGLDELTVFAETKLPYEAEEIAASIYREMAAYSDGGYYYAERAAPMSIAGVSPKRIVNRVFSNHLEIGDNEAKKMTFNSLRNGTILPVTLAPHHAQDAVCFANCEQPISFRYGPLLKTQSALAFDDETAFAINLALASTTAGYSNIGSHVVGILVDFDRDGMLDNDEGLMKLKEIEGVLKQKPNEEHLKEVLHEMKEEPYPIMPFLADELSKLIEKKTGDDLTIR